MNDSTFKLDVTETSAVCPIGETVGRNNHRTNRIPVMSCEGACIRGEIARLAANQLAKQPGYARACHGELFSVPHSEMAKWVHQAGQIVVIDGCHLRCHGRILENLVPANQLRSFNALAQYRRYNDLFEIDAVPQGEREQTGESVAAWVLEQLEEAKPDTCETESSTTCGCVPSKKIEQTVCSSHQGLSQREAEFVALGAAIASNCEPCLRYHVREAMSAGLSIEEIRQAVSIASKVKESPAKRILLLAEQLIQADQSSCGAKDDAPKTSRACCS